MATVNLAANLSILVRITAAASVEAAPGAPGSLTPSTSGPQLATTTASGRLATTTRG